VQALTSFTSATPTATLTVQLQGAPDNGGVPGNWITLDAGAANPLALLQAGERIYTQGIISVAQFPAVAAPVAGTFSCSSGAGTISVASATGLIDGQFIASSGILVPGTQIVSISGTTITITPNTAAAASAGTPFAATSALSTGAGLTKQPRYLRLNYICSANFTAGSIWAGLALDPDRPTLYAPGVQMPPSSSGHWTLAGP
jgi:hypothetical protein